MKRLLLAMLLLVLLCTSAAARTMTVGFLTAEGGLGDLSYNDMTMAGLQKAKSELGIKLVHIIPPKGPDGLAKGMEKLLAKNVDIVVANGFTMRDIVEKTAAENPDKFFILNDNDLTGPNIVSTTFAQHQGSFLVGVLCAEMTKTKKVAFLGGCEFPIIHAFLEGFKEGVKWARADVDVMVEYVAPGKDISGFNSPRVANKKAKELFAKGADIVYAVAGSSGNGALHAAKQMKKFAVGVDSDQDHIAEGFVLTSMMKRLDTASMMEVQQIIAGNFKAGVKDYNLGNKGVSLSPMKYTRDKVSAEAMAKVEEAEKKIVVGELKVTNILAQ